MAGSMQIPRYQIPRNCLRRIITGSIPAASTAGKIMDDPEKHRALREQETKPPRAVFLRLLPQPDRRIQHCRYGNIGQKRFALIPPCEKKGPAYTAYK